MVLQVSAATEIFVVHDSVNFNMGFSGMIGFCRRVLSVEPMTGAYFLFHSKTAKQIRVLTYDGDGWWLATKKFSKGTIKYWPKAEGKLSPLEARELFILLWRGNPENVRYPEFWKKVTR
jgi:transposase